MQELSKELSPSETAFVMREGDVAVPGGKTRIATIVCEPLEQEGFITHSAHGSAA